MSIYKSNGDHGITYEITKHLAVLEEHETGWRKELNIVIWNEGEPKYDIRDWSPDYKQMGRGITLTKKQMDKVVYGYLGDWLEV